MVFVTNKVPVLRWQTDAGAREILRSEEKHITLGRECLFNSEYCSFICSYCLYKSKTNWITLNFCVMSFDYFFL